MFCLEFWVYAVPPIRGKRERGDLTAILTAICSKLTSRNSLTKQPVHRLRSGVLHVWQNVRVHIERHGDGCMSQHLAHDFRIDTLAQQERRGGVAEIMEANQRQPSALQAWLEFTLKNVIPALWTPVRVGEHHILVTPVRSRCEA